VSQQSRELNEDLTRRATDYLTNMNGNGTFELSSSLGIVEKEALHQWAEIHMGFPLSYDQLQRICTQLEDHPTQQRWTLQVGRGWNIMRNGMTLTTTQEGMEAEKKAFVEREVEWSAVQNDIELDDVEDALHIQLPASVDIADCVFVLSNAGHTGKWGFTLPWRENPIELRDFLRGQKIPLHRRSCAPVLYLKRDKPCLVAVFVEREDGNRSFGGVQGKWIVGAKFSVETKESGQRVCLLLRDH